MMQCIYDAVHKRIEGAYSSEDQEVVQINVEDPAPGFVALRNKVDWKLLKEHPEYWSGAHKRWTILSMKHSLPAFPKQKPSKLVPSPAGLPRIRCTLSMNSKSWRHSILLLIMIKMMTMVPQASSARKNWNVDIAC
mmetsp:Transcript_8551/g.20600  ORF Transcript_8551/g.20600 Transcript_8551/m.20600 type:complete len:136 (+) Transcript_8551:171-578(+)